MADEKTWELPYDKAIEAVRRGLFDEVRAALKGLGFVFAETKDPNHLMYYHPLLRGDPLFRYPRNLYRPHGAGRSLTVLRDMTRARQTR